MAGPYYGPSVPSGYPQPPGGYGQQATPGYPPPQGPYGHGPPQAPAYPQPPQLPSYPSPQPANYGPPPPRHDEGGGCLDCFKCLVCCGAKKQPEVGQTARGRGQNYTTGYAPGQGGFAAGQGGYGPGQGGFAPGQGGYGPGQGGYGPGQGGFAPPRGNQGGGAMKSAVGAAVGAAAGAAAGTMAGHAIMGGMGSHGYRPDDSRQGGAPPPEEVNPDNPDHDVSNNTFEDNANDYDDGADYGDD